MTLDFIAHENRCKRTITHTDTDKRRSIGFETLCTTNIRFVLHDMVFQWKIFLISSFRFLSFYDQTNIRVCVKNMPSIAARTTTNGCNQLKFITGSRFGSTISNDEAWLVNEWDECMGVGYGYAMGFFGCPRAPVELYYNYYLYNFQVIVIKYSTTLICLEWQCNGFNKMESNNEGEMKWTWSWWPVCALIIGDFYFFSK